MAIIESPAAAHDQNSPCRVGHAPCTAMVRVVPVATSIAAMLGSPSWVPCFQPPITHTSCSREISAGFERGATSASFRQTCVVRSSAKTSPRPVVPSVVPPAMIS